jgi:hypothetical protein
MWYSDIATATALARARSARLTGTVAWASSLTTAAGGAATAVVAAEPARDSAERVRRRRSFGAVALQRYIAPTSR